MRRTGKAAESDEKRQAEAMTRAVQEAGGERTIGMGNGSRRTAEDNEKRARVSGTFADNREVKSAVGARLSNAKRRQCPSAGKSCVSAVMRRAGILRSVYVRTHDARNNCKIRPEICPNMRACAKFF